MNDSRLPTEAWVKRVAAMPLMTKLSVFQMDLEDSIEEWAAQFPNGVPENEPFRNGWQFGADWIKRNSHFYGLEVSS